MDILERLQIELFVHKYGRCFLLIGLLLFTISALLLGVLNVLDYSLLVVSSIGWIVLALYIIYEYCSEKNRITYKDNPVLSLMYDIQKLNTSRFQRLLTVIFLVIVILILMTLLFYDTRPPVYFILTSLLAGVIAISVIISESQESQIGNVIKALILSFISTLSIFKVYYYADWDVWIHDVWNRLLVEAGFISDFLGKEESTALQHISVAVSDMMMGVDVHLATILVHVIPGVLLSLVVYIIALKYFDKKSAVFGMLIFITSVSTINWLSEAVTTTYAAILYLPLVYILFKLLLDNNLNKLHRIIFSLLYGFFIFVITLTHMFSIFIILFIVAAFYAAACLAERKFINKMLPLVLLPYIWVMGFWIFGAGGFGFNMFSSLVISSIDILMNPTVVDTAILENPEPVDGTSFQTHDTINEIVNEVPDIPSTIMPNLQELNGYLSSFVDSVYLTTAPDAFRIVFTQLWVPISFSIFVVLLWVFFKSNDKKQLWYIAVPYFSALVFFAGIYVLYPNMVIRISAFITLFISLSVACIVNSVIKKSLNISMIKGVVLTVIIIAFSIFCLTQNPIAPDNMFWYEETSIPAGVTYVEYSGMESVVSILPENTKLLSDSYSRPVLMNVGTWEKYLRESEIPNLINRWHQADWRNLFSVDSEDGIIFRDILLTSTTQMVTTYGRSENERYSEFVRLSDDYLSCMEGQFNRLYDNSEVYLYRS